MANPQKENGFTPISNEVLEALCLFRIPGEVRQVVDVVIRKTYGFNKKFDYISHSQIIERTGLKKQNEGRALKKAIEHKLVIRNDDKLGFNKHYDQWIPFVQVIKSDDGKKVIKKATPVIRNDDKSSSETMDTKDIKETYTKEREVIKKVREELEKKGLLRKRANCES